MQVGRPSHRPNFPVAKKAAQRERAHVLGEKRGVVVGVAIEGFAASHAGKEKRPAGLLFDLSDPFKNRTKVFRGTFRVPQMKLDGLTNAEGRSNGQGPVRIVDAQDIAN